MSESDSDEEINSLDLGMVESNETCNLKEKQYCSFGVFLQRLQTTVTNSSERGAVTLV